MIAIVLTFVLRVLNDCGKGATGTNSIFTHQIFMEQIVLLKTSKSCKPGKLIWHFKSMFPNLTVHFAHPQYILKTQMTFTQTK